MIKNTTVILRAESPEAHGVFDEVARTEREIPCTEKGITGRIAAEANAIGITPEIRLVIEQEDEYQGERECVYAGEEYTVQKATTFDKTNGIELLLKRKNGNAARAEQNPGEDGGAET